jgi:glyoxylase-like metal-dependent hydrolase (beta-lactamase superfamily II)
VPFHQAVLVQDGGETAAFIADLIPTVAHLPLPWIMGYDLEPLRTLESKRALLGDAVAGGWRLVFEHDPGIALGVVVAEGKGVGLREVVEAPAAVRVGVESP